MESNWNSINVIPNELFMQIRYSDAAKSIRRRLLSHEAFQKGNECDVLWLHIVKPLTRSF